MGGECLGWRHCKIIINQAANGTQLTSVSVDGGTLLFLVTEPRGRIAKRKNGMVLFLVLLGLSMRRRGVV